MKRIISQFLWKVFALGIFFLFSSPSAFSSHANEVFILELNDVTINPVTADYLTSGIDQAKEEKAHCVIIKLDTPGGLLESTRQIVKKIFSSKIPIVVYISPSGARAGSAGVFITYASHIAAMAPSTNIGAAHPVEFGIGGFGSRDFKEMKHESLNQKDEKIKSDTERKVFQDKSQRNESKESDESGDEDSGKDISSDDPMQSKILNDTVAFIKAMAKKRQRNVEWAIKSVTQSDSITETEALAKGGIELIAQDEKDLLNQLEGRTVDVDSREITLHTKDALLRRVDMDFRQKFFNILANPNIAYIFLILGFYGLLYEITHPGFGIPGVAGIILLILAFFSMQMLPTNYAGVALILLAVVLFIAEAKVGGMGFLMVGGLVSMILGSMLLFDSSTTIGVSVSLIIGLTAATAAITIFLVRAVVRSHRRKVMSGKEELLGAEGVVYSEVVSDQSGKVFLHGEIWNASSDEIIKKDEKIKVVEVKDLAVKVRKIHYS